MHHQLPNGKKPRVNFSQIKKRERHADLCTLLVGEGYDIKQLSVVLGSAGTVNEFPWSCNKWYGHSNFWYAASPAVLADASPEKLPDASPQVVPDASPEVRAADEEEEAASADGSRGNTAAPMKSPVTTTDSGADTSMSLEVGSWWKCAGVPWNSEYAVIVAKQLL
jgi:hypothetical protein